MPVNGTNGSITRDSLAAIPFTFATLTGVPNIVDGTIIAVSQKQELGISFKVALMAPGDPGGFVWVADFDAFSDDHDIAVRVLQSAGLWNSTAVDSAYTWAQLEAGSVQSGVTWTNPQTGVVSGGDQATAAAFDYWLSTTPTSGCLAATQNQWRATMTAYLQTYVNAALASATVTPYVKPSVPTLAGTFPLAANAIPGGMELQEAWNFLTTLTPVPGGVTIGFSNPPPS